MVVNADSSIRTWQRLDHDYRTAPGCAFCGHDAQGIRNYDWLVTPQCTVQVGDTFSFWYRAKDAACRESLEVWISDSSPYIADFVLLDAFGTNSTTYEQKQYDLLPHAGRLVFFALVYRSAGQSGMVIDDAKGPRVWLPSDLAVLGIYGIPHHRLRPPAMIEPSVLICNYRCGTTTLDVWLAIGNVYRQRVTVTGLAPGETRSVYFPPWGAGLGVLEVVTWIEVHDARPWTDTARLTLVVSEFTPRGGPDSFGYYWYDSDDSAGPDYNWQQLSHSTQTRLGGGDDSVFRLSLPWPFRFYGQDYSTAYVSTNGWLSFDSVPPGAQDSNVPLPSTLEPNCLIAPFWDDLLSHGGDAGIWYDHFDSLLVIEWRDFGCDGAWRESLNFQAHLYRSGAIEFHYQRVLVGDERFDQGASATVGIEDQSGTVGLQYLFSGSPPGNYLQAQRAIRFQPWQGGVAERSTPGAERLTSTATISRGVLFLPTVSSHKPQAASWLLDISGRKVLDLMPGPNDVRALAPGVYFVREEPQASSHKPQAVRKVVVER